MTIRQALPPTPDYRGWAIAIAIIIGLGVMVYSCGSATAQPIKTPLDLILSIHKRAFPSQYVQPPQAEPAPKPRLRVKRGFKKPPPPVAETLQQEAAPRVTPAPPRAKVKPRPKPKAAPRQTRARVVVVKPASSISAADCARLRAAVAEHGSKRVNRGGFGYSPADVAYARRECGV